MVESCRDGLALRDREQCWPHSLVRTWPLPVKFDAIPALAHGNGVNAWNSTSCTRLEFDSVDAAMDFMEKVTKALEAA